MRNPDNVDNNPRVFDTGQLETLNDRGTANTTRYVNTADAPVHAGFMGRFGYMLARIFACKSGSSDDDAPVQILPSNSRPVVNLNNSQPLQSAVDENAEREFQKLVEHISERTGKPVEQIEDPVRKFRATVRDAGLECGTLAQYRTAVRKAFSPSGTEQMFNAASELARLGIVDVNRTIGNGMPYLHYLVEKAATKHYVENEAVSFGIRQRVEGLLSLGADPAIRIDGEKSNALHLAVKYDRLDIVQAMVGSRQKGHGAALLEKAARQTDAQSRTPACHARSAKMVEALVELGTEVNGPKLHKPSVWPPICWSSNEEVGKAWLAKGAECRMNKFVSIGGASFFCGGVKTAAAVKVLCSTEAVDELVDMYNLEKKNALHYAPTSEVAQALVDEIGLRHGTESLERLLDEKRHEDHFTALESAGDIGIMKVYLKAGVNVTEETIWHFRGFVNSLSPEEKKRLPANFLAEGMKLLQEKIDSQNSAT